MYESKKYKILTKDRTGITSDILNVINDYNINLQMVEVSSEEVLIKVNNSDEKFLADIKKIDGVIGIKSIKFMNSEKNEKNLLMLIDSIDEGILSVNTDGVIIAYNKSCENIFGIKAKDIVNCDVHEIHGIYEIARYLFDGGENFSYRQLKIKVADKEIDAIVSCRKIYDNSENIIGATFIFKGIGNTIKIAGSLGELDKHDSSLIGESDHIKKIKEYIKRIAKSNSSVMILGESGTGKEVVAKEIVLNGSRADKPFVSINCAALPDDLLESELFGYKKGAFTGAVNDKKGLFTEANTGTIFLDEIGEMGILMQAKLLRVLQEGKIRKVGSTKEEKIDVRVICATNRDIAKMVKEKKFREDLYYRLNVIPIKIPPLRERKEDIPILATFFLKELNQTANKSVKGFTENYLKKLENLDYKGNVRELKNIVERSINISTSEILTSDTIIKTEDLVNKCFGDTSNSHIEGEDSVCVKIAPLKDAVSDFEKHIIIKTMQKREGSIRKTAKELKISHTTLINKCKKYNIDYR